MKLFPVPRGDTPLFIAVGISKRIVRFAIDDIRSVAVPTEGFCAWYRVVDTGNVNGRSLGRAVVFEVTTLFVKAAARSYEKR
jgi:hypothetical protein